MISTLKDFNSGFSLLKRLKAMFNLTYQGGYVPGAPVVKNPPANAGDTDSIPGLRTSPGEGNGNPLQYSCLGNPMDRGAWWITVLGVAKELDTT